MEDTSLATLATISYAKRKHLATSRDKRDLICSIKLIKQQMDANVLETLVLKSNLHISQPFSRMLPINAMT